MKKTKKTVLIVSLVLVLLVLAAGIVLASDQFLIARVLEVRQNSLLVEVSNPAEYRWIERKILGSREYEYIRLMVKNPAEFRKGDFFAALTGSATETSSPPGIGARWIFR